ncbi:hypothetical protein [Lactobacillus sp. LL6]|uniref:hypothetical protein n=1 Tax=Lactobacillus sp. LL6 TaxID=2596827 RepID=UPI001184E2A1|nr:hypothetical protein [Lactobacillus sp. LL6]TSO25735.1 hypothetical protein FOD82_01255 [Lactobacillus sp. LL6]
MMNVKGFVKVVSSVVVGMSLMGVASTAQAASFEAPKLGIAQEMPTNPSIQKGEKIFVTIKDTKKQTVAVYNKDAKKTSKTVKMGSTFTAKDVKKVHGKKIVKINKSQWLSTKDVVKD